MTKQELQAIDGRIMLWMCNCSIFIKLLINADYKLLTVVNNDRFSMSTLLLLY